MDTIDFVICSNFNPDDDGWSSEEEAPVDLPAPEPPTSGPARAPVKAMGRRRDSRSKRPGAASARAHEDRTRAEWAATFDGAYAATFRDLYHLDEALYAHVARAGGVLSKLDGRDWRDRLAGVLGPSLAPG